MKPTNTEIRLKLRDIKGYKLSSPTALKYLRNPEKAKDFLGFFVKVYEARAKRLEQLGLKPETLENFIRLIIR